MIKYGKEQLHILYMEADVTSREYLENTDNKNFRYRVVVDNPVARNIEYIHPLKQEMVNDIINRARRDHYVKRIIIFGSAVTNRCTPFSDLDICIDWTGASHDEDGVYVQETQPMMRFISLKSKGGCDVLSYDDLTNEELKMNIDNGGVLVYEHDV